MAAGRICVEQVVCSPPSPSLLTFNKQMSISSANDSCPLKIWSDPQPPSCLSLLLQCLWSVVFAPQSLMMFCKVALKSPARPCLVISQARALVPTFELFSATKTPGPSPAKQCQCLWSWAPLPVYEWDCHEIMWNNAGTQCHSCEPGKATQPAKHELLSSLVILLSALKSHICVN